MDSSIDFNANVRKSEGLLYTLADAMVAVDSTSGAADATAPQKNGGWFGFISDGMEFVLKEGVEGWIECCSCAISIWSCDYSTYIYC
ncbi:inner membrane protein PPF-1, chloroplastic-like [Tripterygium wilfordii]|uniref:inner membrane protein PPF-1, chloroplastic-like n=1 Tax=Tripterygium wilfordii TaxID=458696 RepID=UPI0018F80939|nr:inner membrane protein PPF-1, chloroplastic-like [Tripterygium wilfordii]